MNADTIDEWRHIVKLESKEGYSVEDVRVLSKLAQSADSEIRLRTAEVLVAVAPEWSESLLIGLSKDNDELVRASACDSLGISENVEVYSLLKEIVLRDTSLLVKNYAILSMVDVALKINAVSKE